MTAELFSFYEFVIKTEWKSHRGFLDTVEPYLSDLVDNWQKDVDQQVKAIEEEGLKDCFIHSKLEIRDELQEYNAILLDSFFTISYALFERELIWLCNFAQQHSGSPFSVRDLGHRDYINRTKVYLETLGIEFPKTSPEWNKIRIYQGIRNKLIHEGGYVDGNWKYLNDSQTMGIVSNIGVVSGDTDFAKLRLTLQVCKEATTNFEKFLMMVYKAIADLDT